MPTVKPVDEILVEKVAGEAEAIFTVEEHSVIGGLGSAVAQLLLNFRHKKPFVFHSFGVRDVFIKNVGDRPYLLKCAGLDVESIIKTVFKKAGLKNKSAQQFL